MCRFAAYLGEPVPIESVLYEPDRALVRQAVDSELMTYLNLGGFGLAAWNDAAPDPGRPLTYRVPTLPSFDRNLRALARSIRARALIAHVRGVVYDSRERVGAHNVHPFLFDGASFTLAQNGDLYDFSRMRFDLLNRIEPGLASLIEGTTDTEWVYALMLSQLDDPFTRIGPEDAARAVMRTLELIRDAREQRRISIQSPVNLVLTDGSWMIATRYAYDYGWYPDDASFFAAEREHDFTSLWYTSGDGTDLAAGGGLVASEPLTRHAAGWLEAPEYSMLVLTRDQTDGVLVETFELDG